MQIICNNELMKIGDKLLTFFHLKRILYLAYNLFI